MLLTLWVAPPKRLGCIVSIGITETNLGKASTLGYPTDNQLINPYQWFLYQKIMPVAYRLSEMVRKINNLPRKEALRANVKY